MSLTFYALFFQKVTEKHNNLTFWKVLSAKYLQFNI